MGIPHLLALSDHMDHLWFDHVRTASPTLLGVEYQEAAMAHSTSDGWLVFEDDGHREKPTRLPSGHWGLPLIGGSDPGE